MSVNIQAVDILDRQVRKPFKGVLQPIAYSRVCFMPGCQHTVETRSDGLSACEGHEAQFQQFLSQRMDQAAEAERKQRRLNRGSC
jgi:hypothetical protein